jgi:hypothetical protein
MNLIGGSRKTAMRRATSYSNGTTADTAIETVGSQAFSLDLEKRSFCALGMETLSLCGGDLRTRSGSVYELKLSDELLQRAFKNTVYLLTEQRAFKNTVYLLTETIEVV